MSACSATTRHGKPCRFPARKGTDRCINHEPGASPSQAAARASQAAAAARRTPSTDLLETVFTLTDRASIQAVIDTVIRLEFAGRISHQRATIILRGCSIAARNFDRSMHTITGPRPQKHDWIAYLDKVESLVSTIDPLLDEATEHDTATFDGPSAPPSPAGSGEGARG